MFNTAGIFNSLIFGFGLATIVVLPENADKWIGVTLILGSLFLLTIMAIVKEFA